MVYSNQDELIEIIIGRAIEVHKSLGAGLSVCAYAQALSYELQDAGLSIETEKQMPVQYKGHQLEATAKFDMIVEETVVIDLKTIEEIKDSDYSEMSSKLRLGDFPIGFIMNFRSSLMKNGIKRVINSRKNQN